MITTTNADFEKLDPAVTRAGRLVGVREFRRLTWDEAARLAQAKGLTLSDQPDFSLAEIYSEKAAGEYRLNREWQIGFA